MRTKHLLTAMVLPALFAACTNDDFQSVAPEAPVNAEGRNLVENVTLNLGAPETRLAYDGNYTWEAEDQIGACLMDEIANGYSNTNNLWRDRFDLVDYIQTNYKFTYDGESAWTTEAKMLEGNYFFCYPYNANKGKRDAYTFSAKAQTMEGTSTADLQKAYAENNSFIGFGKVTQGASEGEALDVELLNVFGATGITIGTYGTQTYTIERIVLRGKNVSVSAKVAPTSCTPALQYGDVVTSPAAPTEFNVAQYTQDVTDMYDATYNTTGEYVVKDSDFGTPKYDRYEALRDVLDYSNGNVQSGAEVTLKGGNVIDASKSINVIVMVKPTTGIDDLANVENTSDAAYNNVVLDIYTDKGIIRDIQLNHRYSANDAVTGGTTNVLTDVALTEVGTGNKVEVKFDDTAVDVPASMEIYGNADLANLIHWNAGIEGTLTASLKADVTLSKAMFAELAASKIASLTIEGTKKVTIAKDVADGALNKIKYNNNSVVVAGGTQSLASNIGAALTINNGATVNVTKEVSLSKNVTNNGTLNVNGKIKGGAIINNNAKMTVSKEIQVVVNNGNMTDPALGTITNTGTIRTLYNVYGVVTNNGSIGATNYKSSTNSAYGEITNNGKAYMASNAGVIYANGVSATNVANNTNGSIVITDLDSDGNFITENGKEGAFVQEITANANTDAVDTRANTVWLSATLSVEKKDSKGVYQAVNLEDIALIATNKSARINGNQASLTLKSITVEDAAAMVLSKEKVVVKTTPVTVGKNAVLTVNSNASLKDALGNKITTVAGTTAGTGTIENFSQLD